jgi:hypothetical protein
VVAGKAFADYRTQKALFGRKAQLGLALVRFPRLALVLGLANAALTIGAMYYYTVTLGMSFLIVLGAFVLALALVFAVTRHWAQMMPVLKHKERRQRLKR